MIKRISTDTYIRIQADLLMAQLQMTGGKSNPMVCKQSVDALLLANECVVVNAMPETEESRLAEEAKKRADLEKKLSL
jgi:hypothetical protein